MENLGCTQGMYITKKDEMWIVTHRNNVENGTYDKLAGRIMNIDLGTGKALGAMESLGHELTVKESTGVMFIGSLTGNALRWYPVIKEWHATRRSAIEAVCLSGEYW